MISYLTRRKFLVVSAKCLAVIALAFPALFGLFQSEALAGIPVVDDVAEGAKNLGNSIKKSGEHLYRRGERIYEHVRGETKDFAQDPIGETIRGLDPRNLADILDDGLRRVETEPVKITGDVIDRTLGENAEKIFYDIVGYIKGLSLYPELCALYFAALASSYALPPHVVGTLDPYFRKENECFALKRARYYIDNTKVFSEVLDRTGSEALTFYDVVIFKEGSYPKKRSPENYEFWAEELYHVSQFLERGLDTFLMIYATSFATHTLIEVLDAMKDGRLPDPKKGYWSNTLERDAQDKAKKVKEDLMKRYGVREDQDIRDSTKYRVKKVKIKPEWHKVNIQGFQRLAKLLPSSTPKEKSQKTKFFMDLGKVYYSTAQDANAVRSFCTAIRENLTPITVSGVLRDMNKSLREMCLVYGETKISELRNEELSKIRETLNTFRDNRRLRSPLQLALGRIELLSGNEDIAFQYFKKSFNENPYNLEAFAEAGRVLADRGQSGFNGIEQLANQSIRNLNIPSTIIINGRVIYDPHFFSRGVIQKRNKATANILFVKGCLYEKQRWERYAIPNYQASIYINPVEPSSYEALGRCLEKIGNKKEACFWYRQCSNIYFYMHLDTKAAELKLKEIQCGQEAGLPMFGSKRDLAKMYLLSDYKLVEISKPLKDVYKAIEYVESSQREMEDCWNRIMMPDLNKWIHDHLAIYYLAREIYTEAGERTKKENTERKIHQIALKHGIRADVLKTYEIEAKTLRRP